MYMGLKTMAKMDALTRHTETNGNTSISLKINKGVAAHSTLLAETHDAKMGGFQSPRGGRS
jgi:hypothetical protein